MSSRIPYQQLQLRAYTVFFFIFTNGPLMRSVGIAATIYLVAICKTLQEVCTFVKVLGKSLFHLNFCTRPGFLGMLLL